MNNIEHTCNFIMINNKQNGINIITKQEIERLFRSKTDTAAKIINVLRSMTNPFKHIKVRRILFE